MFAWALIINDIGLCVRFQVLKNSLVEKYRQVVESSLAC